MNPSQPAPHAAIRPELRWDPSLLEASHDDAVAAWRDSIHGFAKRLAPKDRARFALALDSAIYPLMGESAVAAEGGLHPKHRILQFHDFFVTRIRPGEKVVDLGCGVGALAASIAERSQAHVTGVDWNARNLSRARTIASSRGIVPVPRYIEDDITTCHVEGSFDVVVLSNVLEHLANRPALLRKWIEWYKPSRVLIRVPAIDRDWRPLYKKEIGVEWRLDDTHETEYTRGQLEQELGEAGLAIRELLTRFGEYWLEAAPVDRDEMAIRVPARAADAAFPELSKADYLRLQAQATSRRGLLDVAPSFLHLVAQLAEHISASATRNHRVLCVGCSHGTQLDVLATAGFANAVGVDFQPADPRVLPMDMHSLSFADESFDAIVAARSFERSLEPRKVARELRRVTRTGGIITLECGPGTRDGGVLWNFTSAEKLAEFFPACEIQWLEHSRTADGLIIRLALRATAASK